MLVETLAHERIHNGTVGAECAGSIDERGWGRFLFKL